MTYGGVSHGVMIFARAWGGKFLYGYSIPGEGEDLREEGSFLRILILLLFTTFVA